jgi:hypothetical protein
MSVPEKLQKILAQVSRRKYSRQNIHYLVNKLKRTGSLLDRKTDRKLTVLTEKTLDNIGARLKTSPRKSLKQLVQETGVLRTTA